ncbi:unnamed protein product [Caenorhabditis brenneri]
MKAPFGFHELRITFKEEAKKESVNLLRRFHAYTPILAIFEVDETLKKPLSTIKLDYTKFITARVVLNKEVAKLKRQNGVDKDALRKKYELVDEEDDGGALDENQDNRDVEEELMLSLQLRKKVNMRRKTKLYADGAQEADEIEGEEEAHEDAGFEIDVGDALKTFRTIEVKKSTFWKVIFFIYVIFS